MTLDEFFKYLSKLPIRKYLVDIRYKYDHEKEWERDNEVLEYDWDLDDYAWLNDWNEGQQCVEVLGCIAIDDIKVLGFENGWTKATEKLPDDYMPLFVTIEKDGKRVVVDSYFNAGSKTFIRDTYSDYAEGKVLAWMPWRKPDPWKGR